MIITASRKSIKESFVKVDGKILTKDFEVADYCFSLFSRDQKIEEPQPWSAKWEVTEDDLNELKNNFSTKLKEYNEALTIAKETNEKAHYYSYNEDCNSKHEQCDIDLINIYVMPDGTLKKERIHTH